MRSSSLTSIFAFSTTLLAPLTTALPSYSVVDDLRKAADSARLRAEAKKLVRHITATGWNGGAANFAGRDEGGIRVYDSGDEGCDGIQEFELIDDQRTIHLRTIPQNLKYSHTVCHSRTEHRIDLSAAIASTSAAWDGKLQNLQLFYFTTDGNLTDAYWSPDSGEWTYNTGLNELIPRVDKSMLAATSSVIDGVPNYYVFVVVGLEIIEYSRTGGNGQPWKTRDFTLGNTKEIVGISATSSSVSGVLTKGVYVMYASGTISEHIGPNPPNTWTSKSKFKYSSMATLSTPDGPRLFVQPLDEDFIYELFTNISNPRVAGSLRQVIFQGAQKPTKLAAGFMPGPILGCQVVFYIDSSGKLNFSFRDSYGSWKSAAGKSQGY